MSFLLDVSDQKDIVEQEVQTEEVIETTIKHDIEIQTSPIATIEEILQTDFEEPLKIIDKEEEPKEEEIIAAPIDNEGIEEVQLIIDEIIINATEEKPSEIIALPVEELKEPTITQVEIETSPIEAVELEIQEIILPVKSSNDAETQTKKDKKKKKKQKSTDEARTEVEIETIISTPQEVVETSNVSVKLLPDLHIENIDVHVKVPSQSQSTTAINEDDTIIQRLNVLMSIETSEPVKETFNLSQNLNSLINNIDKNPGNSIPWNEVQYMIDSNIENRRVNSVNEGMVDYEVEEPVDEKINESLLKIEQYINILPEVVNSNQDRVTQKTIIVITKVIITCLEQIEYKIYTLKQNKSRSTTEDNELHRLEVLLHNLRENVAVIQNSDLREDINKCVDTLQHHIDFDKEIQQNCNQDLSNYYVELNNTCDSIKRIQQETILLEDKYSFLVHSDISNDQKLGEMETLESDCKENKKNVAKLLKLNTLNDQQGNDIKACYDRTKDVENGLRMERRKVIQLINLSEEYVATLNEFSQITLIANSLVDKSIVTNSLENLQNEIQRHRKFFINLNHCRNILESLERNIDSETRNKHSQLHRSLHQKATVILEKAGERAQKLAMAASKWTVLENRMKNEEQWLQVAEQRVPDLLNVTSADFEQYINLYQSLNADLTIHHSKILQDYETAMKLQELIYAPSLEMRCNETLTRLLRIKEDVNAYLKRLLHFKNMWQEYNSNADKLEQWMNEVEGELSIIDIPENFMSYPIENMRRFWEIKAQYEFNTQVHKKVLESFDKSLKIISLADDKLQLQFYVQLDDRWQHISNRIDAIKNQITENISTTMPDQNEKLCYLEKELDEILFILNSTKGIIRNPEELNLYIERLIVLKSRIIIVENELVTIGFTSTSETEKVGELCEKSHKIFSGVTEEMEMADLCKGRLNTLRQEIAIIRENQADFFKNLNDCEGAAKLESAVIEKALERCLDMREALSGHWNDIMRVRHLLHTLPTGLRMSVSPVSIEKEISLLEDDYVLIEKRLCEVENLLKNRFSLWKRFERQLEAIQQSIQETDFMVELLTVHGNIDYDRLLKATERLEVNFLLTFKNFYKKQFFTKKTLGSP